MISSNLNYGPSKQLLDTSLYRCVQEAVSQDRETSLASSSIFQIFNLKGAIARLDSWSRPNSLKQRVNFVPEMLSSAGFAMGYFTALFKILIIAASASLIVISPLVRIVVGSLSIITLTISGAILGAKMRQTVDFKGTLQNVPSTKEAVYAKAVALHRQHFTGDTVENRQRKKLILNGRVSKWMSRELEAKLPHIIHDIRLKDPKLSDDAICRFQSVYHDLKTQTDKKLITYALGVIGITLSILSISFAIAGAPLLALGLGIGAAGIDAFDWMFSRGVVENRGWEMSLFNTLPTIVQKIFKRSTKPCTQPSSHSFSTSLETSPSIPSLKTLPFSTTPSSPR